MAYKKGPVEIPDILFCEFSFFAAIRLTNSRIFEPDPLDPQPGDYIEWEYRGKLLGPRNGLAEVVGINIPLIGGSVWYHLKRPF